MPVVAIIYGHESGIVRRFVHCDTMEELGAGQHYGIGESIVILGADKVMKDGKPDLAKGIAIVAEKRGKPAEDARCVVIDNDTGEIVSVTLADPVLDSLPGKSLYRDAKAEPGWKLDDKGEYVAPVAAEDAQPTEAVVKDGG